MHRSGTSALTRLLHEAGADLGSRILPGGEGNEEGHWEDAFAVETDERLLADLGHSWDDVRPLPGDWMRSEAATRARQQIRDYLVSSRFPQPVWAIKDPRMSLLAELWLGAMSDAGFQPGVLLLARHPHEVADSLATRDGMAHGKGMLSWARHMLAAERASRGLSRIVVTYDQLIDDPAAVLRRIRALPGGVALTAPEAMPRSLSTIVRAGARHHQAGDEPVPPTIDAIWRAFRDTAEHPGDTNAFPAIAAEWDRAEELYAPVLRELGREQDALWQRTARAEAALSGSMTQVGDLPQEIAHVGDMVDATRTQLLDSIGGMGMSLAQSTERLNDAVSVELRRMHEENARTIESASSMAAEAGVARDLSPRLEQLREGVEALGSALGEAVSVELRRMQEEHARAVESSSSMAAEAGVARDLSPRMEQLRERVETLGSKLNEAVSVELRRMQEEHSRTLESASAWAAEAALARQLSPRMATLESGLDRMMQVYDGDLRRLQVELEQQKTQCEVVRSANSAMCTELDAAKAEIAQLRRRLPGLEADSAMLQLVRTSWSWRMTKPVRFARRVLSGNVADSDRGKVRRWWALQLAGTRLLPRGYRDKVLHSVRMPASVTPALAERALPAGETDAAAVPTPARRMEGRADVYIWAVIDWHFRTQRPQHLARGLAEAGHRVFYVSNNLVDDASPGFNVEALDSDGRLFQVNLNARGAPAIYYGSPTPEVIADLRRSTGELMQWADSDGGLCIVQHPFWSEVASVVSGSALLYDCMDHHAGFEDNAPDVIAAEARLCAAADLLIVTSEWLDQELASVNASRALIRNASDFAHFRDLPAEVFRDPQGRRILGYYGAIAEWFDADLVHALAREYPDCLVLLIGNDTAGVAGKLRGLANVQFTGEVPYTRLPYYLHAFDVALLPFRVIPLTLATNPVKVYEYLGAGKPVVSVDLPEIAQFGDLVARAKDHASFLERVGECLRTAEDEASIAARMAFASQQTWAHRAGELDSAIAALAEPRVSVIVLTYNNLDFTKACLHSIEAESNWANLEVIVVDNASTDGTPEYLEAWADGVAGRKVILNKANLGFSAGNNVGLAAASGDFLILLNNDTYVTRSWVRTLVNHLKRDPGIGIIGPVTNNIGNEARIAINYSSMAEMKLAAARYTRRHLGHVIEIPTVAFFCVAMPRATYESVGPLDEAFGVGFFEDDDYCRRVEAAGLRVACADDVFVHHHLSASFDALKAEHKQALFERNKAIYEAKWGRWIPHAYREGETPASALDA